MAMDIQKNVSLRNKNTLGIDATAEFFCQAQSVDGVKEAIEFAQSHQLNIRVLGSGSNVVMSDRIAGLVLSYEDASCIVLEDHSDFVLLEVGAGYIWHDFVIDSLNKGWFGLENLALIPGTVGAAPVQNIGAYGVEVESFIESVAGVYLDSGKIFSFDHRECAFAYRESIFKQKLNNSTLITSVRLRLKKQPEVNVSYAPLDEMSKQQGVPSPLTLAQWVIDVRSSKLPDPAQLPNAGSFFKNPVIPLAAYETLFQKHPDMPSYPQGNSVKVPAGWLIDRMGFKGKVFEGNVSVHEKQALVLVNQGGSGQQVIDAAEAIKAAVKSEYGIELEQEPRLFD